jgi:Sap, sulfolipid-1-addressing protein
MSQAIGEVLAFGIGVALSPAAVIAVVLMLVAPGGRVSASVFVASWALSLGAVATLTLLLADSANARQDGAPADWVIAVQIGLAVLLLLLAAWQWRGRGDREAETELPAWMQKVDGLTTPRAAAMAVFLAAAKPKNLLLTIGVAVAVAELGVSATAQAGALAVFVFLGTLAPGIPLAVSLLMGERGTAILAEVRSWMVRENVTIVAVLCLIFAAKLLGDAVFDLGS